MQANVQVTHIESSLSLVTNVIDEIMERCHYLGLKIKRFNGHIHFIFFMRKARLKLKKMLRELLKRYIMDNSMQHGLKTIVPRSDEKFLHVKFPL